MRDRAFGILGMVGGLALLAAFVPGIPWAHDAFNLRLVAFNVGAIAVTVAVAGRVTWRSPSWIRVAAGVAVLANGWYLVMVVLSIGRPVYPAPDPEFRPVFFFAAIALWLADATFGFAAARAGVISRRPALVLGVGSLLALTGVGGLGFTTGPLAAIVEPFTVLGIVLVGLGWLGLGADLARSGRDHRSDGASVIIPTS